MHKLLIENMKFEVGWYFDKVNAVLAASENEFIDSLKKVEQENGGNEFKAFLDSRSFDLRNVYPQIARRSSFLMMYTFMEEWIERLCELLVVTNCSLRVKDMAGRGIFRAVKYLQKVHNVNLPQRLSSGEELKLLSGVRNCIIHSGSRISEDNWKIMNAWKSKVTGYENLKFQEPTKRVIFGVNSIPAISDHIQSVLEEVCTVIEERKDLVPDIADSL